MVVAYAGSLILSTFPKITRLGALPLAVTLAGSFFFTGCLSPSNPLSVVLEESVPAALSRVEGFKILEAMGYSKEKIVATETSFIVEGDMVFTYESLARVKGMPLAKTAQRATTAVRFPKPNLLKVAIHSSMTDWAKFVHQAVNNWNSVNTRLHLELVPITSGPDITIYSDVSPDCPASMQNLPDLTDGQGMVATGGFPGSAISINKNSSRNVNLTRRVTVLTHELGHTIGFQHTDSNDGALVPGTPESDFWSIMAAAGNQIGTLTPDDTKALEILYSGDKPLGGTDLDGDGWDDIVYWRPSNGAWSYRRSSTNFSTSGSMQFGQRGDCPMADTDLDGDGIDERLLWRASSGGVEGWWLAYLSSTGAEFRIRLGMSGDIPIGNHDMDGDGRDDLVVWRWSDGTFYALTSRSNFTMKVSYKWGDIGDTPVGGIDADRDGKDDWVYYRGAQRLFWVRYSSTNFTTSAPYFAGQPGDMPMGGTDLDRDSKDDLTVWRPGNGNWTALTSGSDFGSSQTQQWGMRGDVPIIGSDLDQDGKRDIVVWRPSDGTWNIKKSNMNFSTWTSYVWGQ